MKVITTAPAFPRDTGHDYGDVRGACIKTFRIGAYSWFALYYCAAWGVMLGIEGNGRSSDAAVRDLWSKLHK